MNKFSNWTWFFAAILAFSVGVFSDNNNNNNGQGQGSIKSYNFIIVGAGSAGSIVAAELAKNFPSKTVLLIEEGYYSKINPSIDDMNRFFEMITDPTLARYYTTVEEDNALNREFVIQRAKVTGGCNSINAQDYIWAHEKDFERWGNIDGWTLDDLLPLWDELESVTYHGFESSLGEIWMDRVINASIELGYSFNENWNDLNNGASQEGVCFLRKQSLLVNTSYVQRRTSWTDYVEPVLGYDNLDIMVLTRVNKVILNNGNGKSTRNRKAIGIEIQDIGTLKKEIINVKDEIILSASVYDSPKILQLSGIGDCGELANVNIDCEVNLPGVGKGLQNHVIVTVVSPPIIDTDELLSQLPNYFDASLFPGAGLVTEDGDFHLILYLSSFIDSNTGETRCTLNIAVFANRMLSQGSVTLVDDNPDSLPVIDHNLFDIDGDMELVIKSIRFAREFLYKTNALGGSNVFEDEENEIAPGYDIQTDDEISSWVISQGISFVGAHPTSSCIMSDHDDYDGEHSVVNERLQVKGVSHLRVIDSSIMPKVVSANTNQMSMLIGLKGAKMIIEDHEHMH